MSEERSSIGRHILVLDGWRGFAIAGVLFAHFLTPAYINLGRFGVELFFVLSGRLMAGILFERQADLGRFYARRVSRVYPVLAVFVILVFCASQFSSDFRVLPHEAFAALTFTYNYFAVFNLADAAFFEHIWSLCIEEHMYILLGVLAFLARRFSLPVLPTIFFLAIAFMINGYVQSVGLGLDYKHVFWRSDVRGASILLGAGVYLALQNANLRGRLPSWFVLACGLCACVLNVDVVPDYLKYSIGTLCLAVCIAAIEFSPKFVTTVLGAKVVTVVGLVSYSLYIWQQPFYQMGSTAMWRLLLLPLAIIAALLSYRLVEVPARAWLNQQIDNVVRRRHAVAGFEPAGREM